MFVFLKRQWIYELIHISFNNYTRGDKTMLRPYSETDLPKLQRYQLHDEQLPFTKMPMESVDICVKESSRYPVVLESDGEIVSFFVLHDQEGVAPYTSDQHSILLRSFSTNAIHQRKGYAKSALESLPTYLKKYHSHIKTVYLTVNISNIPARSLYEKVGFIDTGLREEGRSGELIIMVWRID